MTKHHEKSAHLRVVELNDADTDLTCRRWQWLRTDARIFWRYRPDILGHVDIFGRLLGNPAANAACRSANRRREGGQQAVSLVFEERCA
jgi:hypothetical protein